MSGSERERIRGSGRDGVVELCFEPGPQVVGRHRQIRRVAGGVQRTDQLDVREARHVVEVERVVLLVGLLEVRAGPMRRVTEIGRGIGDGQTRGERGRVSQRQVQLDGAELHVVPPHLPFGVVPARGGGVIRRVAGVRERERGLAGAEAAVRERLIAAREDLGAEPERRRHPAGDRRRDGRPGRPDAEDRPVREVRVRSALHRVVDLGEPPHVVVGVVAEAAVADPHLVVHDAPVHVDHLQQPPQAELRLGAEVRAAVREQARVVAERELHGHLDERRRVHELDVVAGVEPPALDVDGAGRHQRLRQMPVHVDGGLVRGRVRVVQVGGLAVQQPGDDVATVVLLLEERERVR